MISATEFAKVKEQISTLHTLTEETAISMDAIRKQISALEADVIKTNARMNSSWAFQSQEEYEKNLNTNYKQELMLYTVRFLVAAIVVVAGVGYVLMRSAVTTIFDERNQGAISNIEKKHNQLLVGQRELQQKEYEWLQYHNWGSERIHLAEFYLHFPQQSNKDQRIDDLLKLAEEYFNDALSVDDKAGSTYWELAELKYYYPKEKFSRPESINEESAIRNYETAIGLYKPYEIAKGWRADCKRRLGDLFLSRVREARGDKKQNQESATKYLLGAREEYATLSRSLVRQYDKKRNEVTAKIKELEDIRKGNKTADVAVGQTQ